MHKKIDIILISGKAEHGKDTFVNLCMEQINSRKYKYNHNINPMVARFADPLKFIARTYFGWDGEKDEKGRHLLQQLGTERGHQIIPGIWSKFISDVVLIKSPDINTVFIPDWRFPEEYYDLVNYDYQDNYVLNKIRYYNDIPVEYVVHTVRVVRINHESKLTAEQLKHASETALDDFEFDYVITAENIKDLDEAAFEFLSYYFGLDDEEYYVY